MGLTQAVLRASLPGGASLRGDVLHALLCAAFWLVPGLDRSALYASVVEHVFGGRTATAAQWSVMAVQVTTYLCGLAVAAVLYAVAPHSAFVRSLRVPHADHPLPWHTQSFGGAEPATTARNAAAGSSDDKYQRERAARYRRLNLKAAAFATVQFSVNAYLTYRVFTTPHNLLLTPDEIPTRAVVALQVLVFWCVLEFGHYWAHRLCHTKWLYWSHALHHAFGDTSVLAATYEHPVSLLMMGALPFGAAVAVCNRLLNLPLHLFTLWQITVAAQLAGIIEHIGFSGSARDDHWNAWGWACAGLVPCCRNAADHDVHHRQLQYNFGGRFLLFDRLFGTYKSPAAIRLLVPAASPPTTTTRLPRDKH